MPRAGLTAGVIVAEAARVVDEAGPDRLTLAELAKRFGVAQPSLYKHVDGLGGVRRMLAVTIMTELGGDLALAAVGRAGPDALRSVALAYRAFAHRHPGCHDYLQRVEPGDEALSAATERVLGVLYAVFAGYGVTGDDAVDAARFARSALHGFVSLELAGGFAMPRSVDRSFERLIAAVDRALQGWSA
jgi:AcrR family transcriptional regulator